MKEYHERHFLRSTKAMMDALDVAEGMSSRELECFRHNFDQFIGGMIDAATVTEKAERYQMGRHDLGKFERLDA